MSGKINNQIHSSKMTDLLLYTIVFLDSETIAGIVNAKIRDNKYLYTFIKHVSPNKNDEIIRQLKIYEYLLQNEPLTIV